MKLGIHKSTKQKVAIKTICKNKVRQQNMGMQIKREVNILKQMKDKNPHVVQLYEVLASKSKIYLVCTSLCYSSHYYAAHVGQSKLILLFLAT